MSVQVSYKKQTMLGIFLILILLFSIEIFLRAYNYSYPNCQFIESEVFEDFSFEQKRNLCFDNDMLKWNFIPYRHLVPDQHMSTSNVNSDGFRGSEIDQNKDKETTRIFVVGGSTVFGVGVSDNDAIPAQLQKIYDSSEIKNVEIINAGIPANMSFDELDLIKENIVNYQPDIVIIYDGFNDIANNYRDASKENVSVNELILRTLMKNESYLTPNVILKNYFKWKSDNRSTTFNSETINEKVSIWTKSLDKVCAIGKENNFQTIIVLQPFLATGSKILSQEEKNYAEKYDSVTMAKHYQVFSDHLDEFKNCENTFDLRNIFDSHNETLFFDQAHLGPYGNKIIAEKLYKISNNFID